MMDELQKNLRTYSGLFHQFSYDCFTSNCIEQSRPKFRLYARFVLRAIFTAKQITIAPARPHNLWTLFIFHPQPSLRLNVIRGLSIFKMAADIVSL